ncbi:MAG: glycosyl hydrolase family 8 [Ignavibacteriaceae bacterium]
MYKSRVFSIRNTALILIFITLTTNYLLSQARPFPQNVEYPYGYQTSLITPEVMLDAYNTWKNSFLKSCNGMYRVSGDDTAFSISEGMGYGMLLTAYFGEKEYFDGLFEFYKSKRTEHAYGLMGWRVTCDDIIDPGSATDGDLDVVYALIVAHYQWGENYLDDAREILSILKEYYFEICGRGYYTMKPGGRFGGCNLTDISYYSPGYFRVFQDVTGDPFWGTIANHSYIILEFGANDTTGLVPDWQTFDGIPGGQGRVDYYRYDACRTPWRMSLDYIWNGNSTAQEWCTRITNFAASIGPTRIVDGYNLNGTPRGQFNNSAFVGGFAAGAMCNSQTVVDDFTRRLLALHNSRQDNQYFNLNLRCLYMLTLTGNFWQPDTVVTDVEKTELLPQNFKLYQNFPNPFNPSTEIKYQLSNGSNINLSVYNMLGQEIKTLVNYYQHGGEYSVSWDATDVNNNPVSSGVYFYQLKTEKHIHQKKMILAR